MSKYLLTLLAFASLSTPLQAHLLKVFAYGTGGEIVGNVYFAGGTTSEGAEIKIYGANEILLSTLLSNPEGGFRYAIIQRENHRIVASTGDGHSAEWILQSSEFGPNKAAPTPQNPGNEQTSASIPEAANKPSIQQAPQYSEAQLEQAIARQLGPLRLQLQQQHDRARLSDILGGIGMIFGIAGIALWWRNRRPVARP